jgi:hypothetical protein
MLLTGFCWLIKWISEPCNEPSVSINGTGYIDQLSDPQLLKKESVLWSQLV